MKKKVKTLPIKLPEKAIDLFCQRWQIKELALFGSVLRDDFRPDSDIDVLVTFTPEAQWSLLDLVKMEYELEKICHRKVDLVMKQSVEESDNWLRKREILETAQTLYVTR